MVGSNRSLLRSFAYQVARRMVGQHGRSFSSSLILAVWVSSHAELQLYICEGEQVFKGVFTPMVTFFKDDDSIDFEKNKAMVDYLIAQGVHGIVLLGSIGEFFNLKLTEKKQFLKEIVAHVNGRTILMAGTGGDNLSEVIELTQYAQSLRVDAALIISPYFFTFSQEQVAYYYSEIARNTDIKILLYNFPDRTGITLSPELVYSLAKKFKKIVGIKDSTNSFMNTRSYILDAKAYLDNFCVLSGYDEYLINNLASGGDGIIGGLSNIEPKLFRSTYDAFSRLDMELVSKNQKKILRLMDLYTVSSPFVLAIKKAINIAGMNCKMRNLDTVLSAEQQQKIVEILAR